MSVSLENSHQIMSILQQEQIKTPDDGQKIDEQLARLRPIVYQKANQYPMPAMTASVALTHFKRAGCGELAQRFAFEYMDHFKSRDVNIITSHNTNDLEGENHCFCAVGDIVTSKELQELKTGAPNELKCQEEHFIPFETFLSNQKEDSLIVDPFFNVIDTARNSYETLRPCVERYQITHVTGVRTYAPEILALVEKVKNNAQKLINSLEIDELQNIIKKCKLDSNKFKDAATKEQALRRLATSPEEEAVDDLCFLLSIGQVNIDAQDTNPNSKNTALHLAISRHHLNNALFLIRQGARMDIKNAKGETAQDLINASPFKEEFNEHLKNPSNA